MASRTSARFAQAITRATRRNASPSSSELSSPPSSPEATSKYFSRKATSNSIKPETKPKIKTEIKPEDELPPSMGDIPAVVPPKNTRVKSGGAPEHWEEMYSLVKEMRLTIPAPVDTMGCERTADRNMTPLVQRFQTLISLMLSSQTKDTVNAATMKRLQTELPGGLTLESILEVEDATLNELIGAVGFHRRKTEYIRKTAVIVRDQFGGDIPDTLEGLVSLPGVGPKMAHLCMSAAWDNTVGIGVDVHVHRICNMWGWVTTKTPEDTRKSLEEWLPKDKWREINWLLVGFGQTICLPRRRKCNDCSLASKGLCRAAWKGEVATKGKRKRVNVEKEENQESEQEWRREDCVEDRKPRRRVKGNVIVRVKTDNDWDSAEGFRDIEVAP